MAGSPRDGKGHRAYRRKADALKRRVGIEGLTCAWCGKTFDLTLPYNDRMAFTADHPVAINAGGHLYDQDLQPFHRHCNAEKSDGPGVEIWAAS